ncbi:transmembrane protein 198 [Bacillus rossius redtenbacheri]|uniref:transmembrane protein 198 n=1 Tax=Bacillus rossius redtenbacheri TaxID=93214 RepID=UPI002FDE812B
MSGLQPGQLVPTARTHNATTAPGGGGGGGEGGVAGVPTAGERCAYVDYNYDVATAVICGMYLVFGVVYSLFGYRCFKAVMFLTGFIFGSIIVYLICLQEKLLPAYGNAGVALGAGVLFGLITMLVQYVGLFMTGFHTGLFLAVISLGVAETFCWQPSSVWATAGVLLGGGLLFAILNLYWQKGLTVIGTSVYGGAIMAGALDYFVEKFLMVKWVWDRVALRDSGPPCWFSWLILSVWPFMILVGMATQWAVTGRGIYHQELPSKKSRTINLQRVRTREQRAELRQKKYRYLYQVRTAHGDVISQSYVQALQRKVCGPGETSTLQSDSTHLTILPADQTQLAALTESEDESREISGDVIQLDRRQGSSRESVDFNLGRPPYR